MFMNTQGQGAASDKKVNKNDCLLKNPLPCAKHCADKSVLLSFVAEQ